MIKDFHAHLGKTSSGDDSTAEALVSTMDHYQIERTAVSCLSGDNMTEQNDYVYAAMQKFPDRIYGYAFINPKNPYALQEIDRNLGDRCMQGVKFHSWKNGYYPDNCPVLDSLFEKIAAYGAHVQTHVGTSPLSTPQAWAEIARRHPDVSVVFTHIGYYDQGYIAIELAKTHHNIYLETSGQYDMFVLQKALNEVDNKKILFGTDWPYKYHAVEISKFDYLQVDEHTKEAIFSQNALNLWHDIG